MPVMSVVMFVTIQEWFSSLVASLCCSANPDAAVCAQLLQHLDYCSILNILMASVSLSCSLSR